MIETVIIIMINLIYIVQFNAISILTELYIVIKYVQTLYMHFCVDIIEH